MSANQEMEFLDRTDGLFLELQAVQARVREIEAEFGSMWRWRPRFWKEQGRLDDRWFKANRELRLAWMAHGRRILHLAKMGAQL